MSDDQPSASPAGVDSRAHDSESFLRRHLDPAERLNEILFGLIMVLTFTLTAGFAVGDGPEASRELLIATIGCNIAWGVIDGAMFLTTRLLERNRTQRALRALHAAPDGAAALAVVDRVVEEVMGGDVTAAATAGERTRLLGLIRDLALRVPVGQPRLRREDLSGAVASGLLVMLATLPAAVPFLLIAAPWQALRVSNLLLVGMLFLVGYHWGRHSYTNRWLAGLAFLLVGLVLVATAIALGG
jgi:hypothetical protein